MTAYLLDTCVFGSREARERFRRARVLYCSVVIQEAMVAVNPEHRRELIKLLRDAVAEGTGVTPSHDDWIEVGRCLGGLVARGTRDGGKYDKPGVALLVRDALIARCAVARGAVVVTYNLRDFEVIKTYMKSLRVASPEGIARVRQR